ncbi:MAG: hypothetical protein A4E43_00815 [Methanosaeta sp. PtaB.Bin005]|nr:MAG: hypothetical protein A4E43_00815 [Methanosaeta sp. PtaB.Bin005]
MSQKVLFLNRLDKMMVVPPRKRMKHGTPCHVVKVTKQAKIVCEIRGEKIYVLHCFGSHKGYERWYRSYK